MSLKRISDSGLLDPVKYNVVNFFDDFVKEVPLTSSEPVSTSSNYVGTALSSGTTSFATDAIGGWCVLSGAATTDNSGSQIQQDVETFGLQLGKDIAFSTRFKVSNAVDSHFFVGLGITDTTFVDGSDGSAALANTASLGFWSPDDSAALYITAGNGASTIVGNSQVTTLVDDTFIVCDFVARASATVSGAVAISVWINGNSVGTFNYVGVSTHTMCITAALVSGTASGTVSASIDYIACTCER